MAAPPSQGAAPNTTASAHTMHGNNATAADMNLGHNIGHGMLNCEVDKSQTTSNLDGNDATWSCLWRKTFCACVKEEATARSVNKSSPSHLFMKKMCPFSPLYFVLIFLCLLLWAVRIDT